VPLEGCGDAQVVVMEKRKRLLGDDHPDTLRSMASLAVTYGNQGRWDDAATLGVMVVEKMKWVLGDAHPDTIMSMKHLAWLLEECDRIEEPRAASS
jgi:hypothetical protein